MLARLDGIFIHRCLCSKHCANEGCEPLSKGSHVQNIPHRPVCAAASEGCTAMSRMQTRRPVLRVLEVDGVRYSWVVRREPQWSSMDGWKGLCIEVHCPEVAGRTLLLELPFVKATSRSVLYRQRPKVAESDLGLHIRQALSAGWLPGSRGKPFVFEVVPEIRQAISASPATM